MKYFLIIIGLIFFTACGNKNAVQKALKNADSVYVSFTDTTAIKKTSFTNKTDIDELSAALSGDVVKPNDCAYDGNIFFYEKGKEILHADFVSKQKNCIHFSYKFNNLEFNIVMNDKIADMLNK